MALWYTLLSVGATQIRPVPTMEERLAPAFFFSWVTVAFDATGAKERALQAVMKPQTIDTMLRAKNSKLQKEASIFRWWSNSRGASFERSRKVPALAALFPRRRALLATSSFVFALAVVFPCSAQTSGLVAAYGFNEGAGTSVADSSGNANTGTINGAAWTTQGRSGGALSFNGTSSRVLINDSNSLDLATGMTLEAWVNPAVAQSGWRTVIQKEVDTYLLHAGSVSPLVPAVGGTYGGTVAWMPATGSITVGQWSHLAGTYDGTRMRLYINGVEVASAARTGTISVNNLPVRIGGNSPYGEYFNGLIDEVRIYNRALSAAEIQSDMNTPVGGSLPANTAPTITDMADRAINENANTGAIGFTIGDGQTAAGSLAVTGSSSNPTLVPSGNIVFGGSGASRTVTVTPVANQSGTATITVTVSDGALTANDTFLLTVLAGNTANDPAVVGQWGGPYEWPFVAIHLTLLPTGEVLGWDDHTENQGFYLWSPQGGTFVVFPQSELNLWCSGHTALPDGRILIAGGTGSTFNIGLRQASLYDPQLKTFSDAAPMRYARYYPTAIGLSDGRSLVLSGTDGCSSCFQEIPEIFNPVTGSWTELSAARLGIPYYPHVFLLPDGRILVSGTSEAAVPTRVLDLNTQNWTVLDTDEASSGSAAMYLPGKILRAGRAGTPSANAPASATTQVMDTTVPSPSWRTTMPMAFPRTHHNLTVLPDGTVLVTGGGRNSSWSLLDEAVLEAEVWSPATETWTTLAAMQTPRLYHGTSLLLPDGRVLVAGSGRPTGLGGVDQFSAEIYSPPYLFRGSRPVINSSPQMVPHGSSFFLGTPDASRISKISLVRLGSATHAFNQDQRYLPLTFQPAPGGFTVQVPADPKVAPPGHYMLFVVDNLGVPSVSAMVRLPTAAEDLTPPTAPGNLSAVVATGSVSLSWTAASDNIAVVKYNVHRSVTPGFAPSGSNRIAETTSTNFTDLGIQATGLYFYRVTAGDAAGNVGPPTSELGVSAVADTTPPSVPANLLPLVIAQNRIDLSWNASSDNLGVVSGYTVFRNSVQVASVLGTSFSDATLAPATTYSYAVAAFDPAGNSSQLSPAVSAMTPQASSGLVAAYGFNEGAGTSVADSSGNANTGTINGAAWTTQGRSGGALSFNGTSSRVLINDSNSLDLATGMTLEAWVNPAVAQSGWRTVIQKEVDTYLLHAGSVSPLVPAVGGTYGGTVAWMPATGSITVGQWSHLAGTYDGTRMRLYINGVEVASAARTGTISVNNLPVRIGGNSPYGEYFNGLIDEVRIYNRALSAAEIQSDMNVISPAPVITAPGNQAGVVGNAVNRQMLATDPNGDPLTWSASGLPAGVSINPSTGLASGTPNTVGIYSTTVTVTDGNTTPVSTSFTWTINNVLTLQTLAGSAVAAGNSVALAAQSSGGLNPQFRWSFGDGTPDTSFSGSPTTTHLYTNPGRYLVAVTSRDDTGREVTSSYWQAIHAVLTASRPTASSSLAYEDRSGANDRLWVVNPDNDSVTVFDTVTRAKLAEVNVGRSPRTLAVGPDGRVWVVNADSATITILAANLSLSQTVNLPRGSRPYGIVFDPAGANAYVALENGGRLLKLNPANGATMASLDVGLNVRHLSVTADGALILAARFISPRLPGEETAAPQTTFDGVKHGGEVLAINAGTFTLGQTVVIEHSEAPETPNSAKGIPNYLGAAVISPDGQSAWVPSKQDNIKRGMLRNASPLTHETAMRSIASRIVLATRLEDLAGRLDFNDAGVASAAAFDPKGNYLFTALEGNREIAVADVWAKQEILRFDAGRAPQGLVLSPDGRTLYVHNFMDRTVTVHDLKALADGANTVPPAPVVMSCVTTEKLAPQVLVGKQLFYDARDARLAFQQYISCAGCHNDGGHDGRTWDFSQFGEGLRNTITLRGKGGVAHGPLHWTGNFDEVQDFEGQIRNFALGQGLMNNTDFHAGTRSQPLGDPKSGLSADLDALAAFVSSLTAHGDSPHRNADGSLTVAALAGLPVFQQLNCAQCHSGSRYTDSALNVFHDVGTLKPSSGRRLGATLTGLDTPTLLGLWGTGPYLHDGLAATLEAAVTAHNGVALGAADLSNLVAFLRQLDGGSFLPNTGPTISDIANQTIDEDAATGTLALAVGDAETEAGRLTVTGSSSDPILVPGGNIVFGGSGASRTVTVTPAAGLYGTATIAVSVSDGTLTAIDTFVLTVNGANDAPTISDVANQTTPVNTATPAIAFAIGDIDTAAESLTVSGSSGNATLVPNGNIVFSGSGSSRTVTVTPAANQSGTATITLTVSDGTLTANDTFVLTVNPASVLPTPWLMADIGPVGIAGSASESAGTYTVKGSGLGPTGTSDQFRYVYQTLSGDGSITARLVSQSGTATAAYGGVMIRESAATNSRFAMVIHRGSGNSNMRAIRRTTTGGSPASTSSTSQTPPNCWMRITRTGNSFSMQRSTDGTSWTTITTSTITMASQITIGIVVTSGSNAVLDTDVFDNVTVVP